MALSERGLESTGNLRRGSSPSYRGLRLVQSSTTGTREILRQPTVFSN